MSYDVANGDVLEVTIQGVMNSQRVLHVLHYELNDLPAPTDGPTLIDDFNLVFNVPGAGSYIGDFAAVVCDSYKFQTVVYQWIFATRRARIVYVPAVLQGEVATTAAPVNLAVAITRRTDDPGPSGHGTIHLAGVPLENIDASLLKPDALPLYDDIVAQQEEMITAGGGANLYPVVFPKLNPALFKRIVSGQLQQTVRTMHRRTVGVGE